MITIAEMKKHLANGTSWPWCAPTDIAYLLSRIERLEKVVEAAQSLRKHWLNEHAHFACGGEAVLLESLAALDADYLEAKEK